MTAEIAAETTNTMTEATDLTFARPRADDTRLVLGVSAAHFVSHFYMLVLPPLFGLEGSVVDVGFRTVTEAVLIYLGLPFLAGFLTRRILIARKGAAWYEGVFLPKISPWALYGLLFTIVILFSLQGEQIIDRPLDVARIALPLLAYFALMWGGGFAVGIALRMSYARTTTLAFTAAGNNFELAIAVAIGTFGAASGQALAGARVRVRAAGEALGRGAEGGGGHAIMRPQRWTRRPPRRAAANPQPEVRARSAREPGPAHGRRRPRNARRLRQSSPRFLAG